jgi:hypothetical protein
MPASRRRNAATSSNSGNRRAVGLADLLLPVATAADRYLAVRKKAARDHANGEIRVAQLRRAVFVIGTRDGADTGVVRVEADCRHETCSARRA